MESINCIICLEDNVVRGYICECRKGLSISESVCVDCELSVSNAKCPLCRRDYPPALVRYATSKCRERYEAKFNQQQRIDENRARLGDVYFRMIRKFDFDPRVVDLVFFLSEEQNLIQRRIINSIEEFAASELNQGEPDIEAINQAIEIYYWIIMYGEVNMEPRIDDIINDIIEEQHKPRRVRRRDIPRQIYADRIPRPTILRRHKTFK